MSVYACRVGTEPVVIDGNTFILHTVFGTVGEIPQTISQDASRMGSVRRGLGFPYSKDSIRAYAIPFQTRTPVGRFEKYLAKDLGILPAPYAEFKHPGDRLPCVPTEEPKNSDDLGPFVRATSTLLGTISENGFAYTLVPRPVDYQARLTTFKS